MSIDASCQGAPSSSAGAAAGTAAGALAAASASSDNRPAKKPLSQRRCSRVKGAVAGGGSYVIEPDRRAAIRLALRAAAAGDVVVVAGRGHEPLQEVGGAFLPFDDRVVVREELEAIGGAA